MKKTILLLIAACYMVAAQAQTVSTFAGSGSSSLINGQGISAAFNSPRQICSDPSGNLYLADNFNSVIRKITGTGLVSSLAYTFSEPEGVAADASGNLYVSDPFYQQIFKYELSSGIVTALAGQVSQGGSGNSGFADGQGTNAMFNNPAHICVDAAGNVYVADNGNNAIRKISPSGYVNTLAGSGAAGFSDNTNGALATFNGPWGICVDASGNVYVSDQGNNAIRKISPSGAVTTLAGNGSSGHANGTGTAATFSGPNGLCADGGGNIYVAAGPNSTIRKITAGGVVTTYAGTGSFGIGGPVDGPAATATFVVPDGICQYPSGNLYVTDQNRVRKITSACTESVNISSNITNLDTRSGNVVMTAIPVGGGTRPAYAWYKNGSMISGAASSVLSYGSTMGNGDQIYCTMIPATGCAAGQIATSNVITFTKSGSSAKDITTLTMPAQVGNSVINSGAATVSAVVTTAPAGRTAIHPTRIITSTSSTYGPSYANNQDFSHPVTYTVTAQDGSTKVWTVTVVDQAGHKTSDAINELNTMTEMNLYPNPAVSYLNVKATGGTAMPVITIIDMAGRVMYHQALPVTDMINHQIDLTGFAAGTYIMHVAVGEKLETKKFVVSE